MLVHHAGKASFEPVRLATPVVTIGRIDGNDVVLNNPSVSRRHAKLMVSETGVTAHDLDSHNGVFLNGQRIRSAALGPNDLLYVGDVCVRLEREEAPEGTNITSMISHVDISDEDDPLARSIAALSVAARCCGSGASPRWAAEVVQACRELVEASVGALLEVHSDGEVRTIASVPDAGPRGGPPILMPVVLRAVSSGEAQFAADLRVQKWVEPLAPEAHRAVMAVPVLLPDAKNANVQGVIYMSRPIAGPTFDHEHVEVVANIANIIGLKMARGRFDDEKTNATGGSGIVDALARISELESELTDARGMTVATSERIRALETELESSRAEVERQRLALAKSTAEGNSARASGRAEAEKLQADFDRAQRELGEVQGELDRAHREIEQVQGEIEKIRLAFDRSTHDLESARARADEAEAHSAALRDDVERNRDVLHSLASERDAAMARTNALEQELVAARQDVEHSQATLPAIAAERDGALARVSLLESQLQSLGEEVEQSRNTLTQLAAERDRALSRLAELEREFAALRDDLDGNRHQQAAGVAAAEALRTALRVSLLPSMADHVESVASGTTPPTSIQMRTLTVLHVAMGGFDEFCQRAPTDLVKTTLDRFCAAVAERAGARLGRIEQVVGHGHLVVFDATDKGALRAVHCALDLAALFPGTDGVPGVVAGVHCGQAVTGFFGGGASASHVEAGAPVVVARAASEFALVGGPGSPPGGSPASGAGSGSGGVVISEDIRVLVQAATGMRITRLGPVWIQGVRAAIALSVVERVSGSAA